MHFFRVSPNRFYGTLTANGRPERSVIMPREVELAEREENACRPLSPAYPGRYL